LTLIHAYRPLVGLFAPFWVNLEVPKCPKTTQKTYFLVAPDHFFLKNGPNDMVRGLLSSLNIGTYILPTCGPLCTFRGIFWGAPKQHKETIFWLFWTISPTRLGLMIWLAAYFQAWTLEHTSCLLANLCVAFWVHLGVPKCPETA
jgi:hypothetical protein